MDSLNYILITGATSGIGRHIVINLSQKYNLIINGRNNKTLIEILNECGNKERHLMWIFDLKEIEELETAFKGFLEEKKVTVSRFVHCAGFLKMLPLKSISLMNLKETMNVNFNCAVLIIKLLINKKANNSTLNNVVFISSTASIMGAKAFNVYSASKGALDSLMRSLAVELAPQVRLNSVLPGGIQTKMTEAIFSDEELSDKMAKEYPLGIGDVNDIYEMVDFLISERSRWITGQQFVVDGGRSINISA